MDVPLPGECEIMPRSTDVPEQNSPAPLRPLEERLFHAFLFADRNPFQRMFLSLVRENSFE